MYPGDYNTSYDKDIAITRTKTQWSLWAVLFLILFAIIPLFAGSYWINYVNFIAIAVVAVLGLHIITGCCGLISLGQAAFMGAGAYTAGILANSFGLPFWLNIPCAGISAGIIGVLFGLPALRVKGFYLSMTTLAAQFVIIWVLFHGGDVTGEAVGLLVPYAQLGGITFDSDRSSYFLIMGVTVLMTFFAMNVTRTRAGRALIAIRDNDRAAEVMGISLFRYKLQAFFIGCFFAGVAGALWAYYMSYLKPDQFLMKESVWFLGMIIVGGMGSTFGAVAGTVFIKGLDLGIDKLGGQLASVFPSLEGVLTSALGLMLFALVITVFLIAEPRGLAHRWQLIKNSYRLWPYSY